MDMDRIKMSVQAVNICAGTLKIHRYRKCAIPGSKIIPGKWWNILQSILGSLGSNVSLKRESTMETLHEILSYLNFFRANILQILQFIDIAYRFFEFLKDWASSWGPDRPVDY